MVLIIKAENVFTGEERIFTYVTPRVPEWEDSSPYWVMDSRRKDRTDWFKFIMTELGAIQIFLDMLSNPAQWNFWGRPQLREYFKTVDLTLYTKKMCACGRDEPVEAFGECGAALCDSCLSDHRIRPGLCGYCYSGKIED
jgi:hypothetical protein